jgi:hypothetical protein
VNISGIDNKDTFGFPIFSNLKNLWSISGLQTVYKDRVTNST